MKRFFVILFVITFFPCLAFGKSEAFFTPSLDCENRIIYLINRSRGTIDVAVYAINNDAIVKALKKAHKKGVKIRVLTDRIQAGQKNSKVAELEEAGIPVIRHKKHKIQHDKFAIFDSKKAVTGSYNWTNAASKKNSENCLFFTDRSIEDYIQRFEYLWTLNEGSQPTE
ncbi:MAG: phospholipase D family protein [Alphaproteobacteria bacterium]|nr:phospholipase D family protein [Alphaproteobacteria bacterium]